MSRWGRNLSFSPVCNSEPHRYVLGNKANGKEQGTPGCSPSPALVFALSEGTVFCEPVLMRSGPDLLLHAGEEGIHVSWTSPPGATPTRRRDPVVEMTWDLIGSNLHKIHQMALAEFTQLQISANEGKKGMS